MSVIEEFSESMDNVKLVIDHKGVICFNVCDLLKKYSTFRIPDFQRFYIWGNKNVDQLYKDIHTSIEDENELFLGNTILRKNENDIIIIDGQQRLVTILIMLRCIVGSKTKVGRYYLESFQKILENISVEKGIKIELLDPTPKFFDDFILKGQDIDLDDFKDKNIEPINKIISAKVLLEKYFEKLTGAELNRFSNFLTKYTKIVAIFPEILENEIYDSINSKGVPLTEADKIKNFLFSRINLEDKKILYDNWYKLIKIFNYSSKRLSSFMELYWNTTKEDPKRGLYKRIEKNFEERKLDPIKFSEELLEYAEIYSQIFRSELSVEYWGGGKYGSSITEVINNLRYLDMKTSYYLILEARSSFRSYFECSGKKKFMLDVVDLFKDIERYSFMYINLLDNYPQPLKDFYSKKSIELKNATKAKKEKFRQIRKSIKEEIKKNIEGSNFEDRIAYKCNYPNKFSRGEIVYLMYKLLSELTKTDIFEKDIVLLNKKTIEHIMPQSMSDPWKNKIKIYLEDWNEYSKRSIEERIEKYHKSFLNDVGNLALLKHATNNELDNLSFPEKQKILKEKEQDNRLFDTVINSSEWSHKEIIDRRELLISRLKGIFSPKEL